MLEVGVGTGLSLPLYPPYVRLTGIDLSREMLDKARCACERRQLTNVEGLHEMDAEAMDFPDASFDKIVAMYVVSVVPEPARLLRELHRVCKPRRRHLHREPRALGEPGGRRGGEKPRALLRHSSASIPISSCTAWSTAPPRVEHISNVNFFWKVMRVRNGTGTAHK